MNRMLSLVKTQLNMNFGISALKYRFTKEKKKRWEPILIGVAILLGVGPLLAFYVLGMTGIFAVGVALNQPEIVLTITFMLSQMVVLFFGMFYIIGNFYFSHDIETLVPLPLKPYEVVGSKFLVVMVNEYITVLPILLPPLFIYGIGTGQGLFYWLKGFLLILAAPVMPLILGAVFIMLLMRVVNLKRNKDLFAIIGGFAGVLLALGVNFFVQRIPKTAGQDYFQNLLESNMGMIREIGRRFPPSIWATRGLADNGLLGFGYFALFIGVSLLLFAALLWLGNLVFYKALLAGQEVSRKRKVPTAREAELLYQKVSSPVSAIIKREWKLLLRTPVYVINGLTGAFIGPFMLLVLLFAQGSSESMEISKAIGEPAYALYVALGGLAVMLFTSGMNLVASTSISREGKTLWILKMIPVSTREQVMAKFTQSFMVSVLGILTTALVLGFFIRLSLLRLLVIILLALLGSVPLVALNLLLDVFHPKLSWNSEQEAMKQNMNGGLGMLLSVLVMLLLAGAAIVLAVVQAAEWMVFAGIGLVSLVLGVLSMLLLFAVAEKKYKEYEA